jgi:hypothetical protein
MVDRIQADGSIKQVAHNTIVSREELATVPAPQNSELRHRAIASSSRVLTAGREQVGLVPHISGVDHLIKDMKALSTNELLNQKLDQILAKIFPAYGAIKSGHVEASLQKLADAAVSELQGLRSKAPQFVDIAGDAIPSASDNTNSKVNATDEPLVRMERSLQQIAQMREAMASDDAQRYERMLSANQVSDTKYASQKIQSSNELSARAAEVISVSAQSASLAHGGLTGDVARMLLN